jgi:hypothetical protein
MMFKAIPGHDLFLDTDVTLYTELKALNTKTILITDYAPTTQGYYKSVTL